MIPMNTNTASNDSEQAAESGSSRPSPSKVADGAASTSDGFSDTPPQLNAEIFVMTETDWWPKITEAIPDELPVRTFRSIAAGISALSDNIALVIISASVPDEQLRRLIRQTLVKSGHARIVLLASEHVRLLQSEVARDEDFVFPEELEDLEMGIKKQYVQSYYEVTLDRYYKVCLAISNYEQAAEKDAADDDVDLEQLEARQHQLRSSLDRFRRYLNQDDYDDIVSRKHRYTDLTDRRSRSSTPSTYGLPDSCPDCGLDWTTWHDGSKRYGYEMTGAQTWRCTDCGHIIAENDPDNYRVG